MNDELLNYSVQSLRFNSHCWQINILLKEVLRKLFSLRIGSSRWRFFHLGWRQCSWFWELVWGRTKRQWPGNSTSDWLKMCLVTSDWSGWRGLCGAISLGEWQVEWCWLLWLQNTDMHEQQMWVEWTWHDITECFVTTLCSSGHNRSCHNNCHASTDNQSSDTITFLFTVNISETNGVIKNIINNYRTKNNEDNSDCRQWQSNTSSSS